MRPARVEDSLLQESDLNNPVMYKIHPALFGQYVLSEIFPFAEKSGANNEALFKTKVVGNYLKHIAEVKGREKKDLGEESDSLSCASSETCHSADLEALELPCLMENFFHSEKYMAAHAWKTDCPNTTNAEEGSTEKEKVEKGLVLFEDWSRCAHYSLSSDSSFRYREKGSTRRIKQIKNKKMKKDGGGLQHDDIEHLHNIEFGPSCSSQVQKLSSFLERGNKLHLHIRANHTISNVTFTRIESRGIQSISQYQETPEI